MMYAVFMSMSVSWSSSPESGSRLVLTTVSKRVVKILSYDVVGLSCGGCCCGVSGGSGGGCCGRSCGGCCCDG